MLKNLPKRINKYYLKHEIAGRSLVTFFGFFLILLTFSLVFFIASKGLATFFQNHFSPIEFLFSTNWDPGRDYSEGGPAIGALTFIIGSISISGLALIICSPFAIGASIFTAEISPKLGKKLLQPAIEIFVGIPSVVYGWVGLSVLVPFIKKIFGGFGFSLLAGALVLAVMIFPTIASLSVDTLRALPKDYKEASYALGATRWQTIRKVLLPSAAPGILSASVLGLARAFGEALAVQMVIGNAVSIPKSLIDPTINLTSIITMDMGNTVTGQAWNNALWSMALLLLIISFIFIIIIRKIGNKGGVQQ